MKEVIEFKLPQQPELKEKTPLIKIILEQYYRGTSRWLGTNRGKGAVLGFAAGVAGYTLASLNPLNSTEFNKWITLLQESKDEATLFAQYAFTYGILGTMLGYELGNILDKRKRLREEKEVLTKLEESKKYLEELHISNLYKRYRRADPLTLKYRNLSGYRKINY